MGKKGAAQQITRQERRTQVLSLRRAGGALRDIAVQLRTSEATVRRDLRQALAALVAEERDGAAELRALEGARLDALQLAHWKAAIGGDVKAAHLVLDIMVQRARLFGLNAEPDTTLPTDTMIILRWADGNQIIDLPAHPGDHPAAALCEPASDSDEPGAVSYRVLWETVGQEPAGGDAQH